MVNLDTMEDSDMEKAQGREYQATWQTKDFSILRPFDLPSTRPPNFKPLESHLTGMFEMVWIIQYLLAVSLLKQKSRLDELECFLKKSIGSALRDKKRNLENHLFNSENHLFTKYPAIEPESCNKRLEIAIGVDEGLVFHHVSEEQDMCKDFKLNNILIDLKVSNMLLDKTTASTCRWNNYATNVDGSTTLNIPSVSQQRGKTNMKIEKTVGCTGAPKAETLVEMASEWWRNRSYEYKTWPMKVKKPSQSNVHHLLLLIFTLLATITFHTALKFYLPRCRLQDGYEANSSLDSVFQIENQRSYSTRILIMFNSVAFFLSVGMLMILFNNLPCRLLLLLLVFSMIGSYMCLLMDPLNPSLRSS